MILPLIVCYENDLTFLFIPFLNIGPQFPIKNLNKSIENGRLTSASRRSSGSSLSGTSVDTAKVPTHLTSTSMPESPPVRINIFR